MQQPLAASRTTGSSPDGDPCSILPYEDESRSVAVGYGEVGLAGGLEIAFARKREERLPKEPPP